MPSAIFFNGQRIVQPGAYTKIDASQLSTISPSAKGIVALIGTAEGGKPLSVDEADSDHSGDSSLRNTYRSGDLLTAGLFAFDPSNDDAVKGAQKLVTVKVNPATQSTATLPDDDAANSVDLTSRDYGLFTTQISIEVAAGTTLGKKITVTFEDTVEVFDDVGGTSIFDVLYTPGSEGYNTVTGAITASTFTAAATKAETGLSAELTSSTPVGLPAALEAVSDNAGDTTQTVTIYGLVGTVATQTTVTLNGTTAVPTTGITGWTKVLGARKSAATLGTVTLRVSPGGATALTLAAGTLTRGIVVLTNTPVQGVLTVSIDVNTAVDVAIFGESPTGAATGERFDMTTAATTPVVGVVQMRKQTIMALGDVAGARTITVSCNAVQTSNSVFTTVQRLVDYLNGLDGFTATAEVTNPTTFLVADADYAAAGTLIGAARDFYADNFFFIEALNEGSQFVTGERAASADEVPANTTAPVFLAGGVEGTPTITEWTQAFQLLRKRFVNIIVPLTRDSAIHALLLAHLRLRAGKLRSEANGYVGIGEADGDPEVLANVRSQIRTLNSRHVSAVIQRMKRNDPFTGEATWYAPHFYAAIAAGMQGGAPIGEPLTHKRPNVLDIGDGADWTIEDDTDLLIDSGAMISEKNDRAGVRWIRSITTHLADDNVVFSEMSANESANIATFRFRERMELRIGQRGVAGTVGSMKGLANAVLGELLDDEVIVAHRALQVEQIGDVFPISVEIAPVLPINFIPITIHLVAVRLAA